MVLPIVKYGNPVLREKGRLIDQVTPELEQLVADMFDTMYDARGIGLAAQQIDRALQLTVIDVRGVEDRPSYVWLNGQPADVAAFMPLVLINPQLDPQGETIAGAEGCLSFPEMYADIVRPEFVEVRALNARGEPINFRAGGLLARAIQHEADHLQGILFIDRMSRDDREDLRGEIETLQNTTREILRAQKSAKKG